MFYEEKVISENLKCVECKRRYEIPVVLPCGETVCQRCVDEKIIRHSTQQHYFQCFVCDQIHHRSSSTSEFPVNKLVLKLLQAKEHEVVRSELVSDFKRNLAVIADITSNAAYRLANRTQVIREDFDLKRHRLHLTVESRHEELNHRADELFSELESIEQTCLAKTEEEGQNAEMKREIREKIGELNELIEKWESDLKKPSLDERAVREANTYLDEQGRRLSRAIECYLFDYESIEFVECDEQQQRQQLLQFCRIERKTLRNLSSSKDFVRIKNDELLSSRDQVIGFCLLKWDFIAVAYFAENWDLNGAVKESICFQFFDKNGHCVRSVKSKPKFIRSQNSIHPQSGATQFQATRAYILFAYLEQQQHGCSFFFFDATIYELIRCHDNNIDVNHTCQIDADKYYIYIHARNSVGVDVYDWKSMLKLKTITHDSFSQMAPNRPFRMTKCRVYMINVEHELLVVDLIDGELSRIKTDLTGDDQIGFASSNNESRNTLIGFRRRDRILYVDLNPNKSMQQQFIRELDEDETGTRFPFDYQCNVNKNANGRLIFYQTDGTFLREKLHDEQQST